MSGNWKPDSQYSPTTGNEAATARADAIEDREPECLAKAKQRKDLTFTLVGQDLSSPQVICEWIKLNIETCPREKLMEALDKAIRMRDLPLVNRKDAD